MKELTIEEKAQKYDEAIERGKSLLSDNKIGNAWIYKLLPELAENKDEKESEDERIRKQLKAFIHSRASLITQSKHDSWIAWLEKQAFNAYNAKKEWGKDDITRINEIIETLNIVQANRVRTQRMHYSIATIDKNIDWLKSLKDRVRPNQEWSEEDKKMIVKICKNLYDYPRVNSPFDNNSFKEAQKQVDWLKSLKDRVQPNQEWSDEDEAKRNALIGLVEEIKRQPLKRLEDWDGYISWLKSLKDRVQPNQEWSEEDKTMKIHTLEIINKYWNSIPDTDYDENEISESCYNWLKSLRPQNNITDEELAQAKKDAYNDALDKIEYHSGEPTFDDGWSAAIWYLKKRNT